MKRLILGVLFLLLAATAAQAQTVPNAAATPFVKLQYLSSTGAPLVGGKIYTYAAGGTTPLDTYTTSCSGVALSMCTTNANPVILDAGGRAAIFLGPSCYKLVAQNSLGTQQWTIDNICDIGLLLTQNFATKVDDKVCHASQYTGTTPDDAGGKIAYCINSVLPSTGGVVDARGIQGAQTWSADPFSGVTKAVELLISGATYGVNAPTTVPTSVQITASEGSVFSVAPGSTLAINGSFQGSMSRHFSGVGKTYLNPGKITVYPEWWGAKADGTVNNSVVSGTDSTLSIQNAVTAVCGNGTTAATGSTIGSHGQFRFLPGLYITSSTITIPPSCYADFGGASAKGTYILAATGTGPALQIQGAFNSVTATRTSSEFDANVVVHDISMGSKVGHAVQVINGYRTKLERIYAFSAGATSNYFDWDGASVIRGDDLYVTGNDTFPGNIFTAPYGFTQGVVGHYITARVDSFGYAGRYNISGEFFFNNLYCEGQQTGDCIYTYVPSGTDFSLFPIFVTGADIAITSGKAAYRQNGKAIAYVSNCYCERANSGTVDVIRIDSDQGAGTVYANNIVGSTARLNFNGDGTNKPSLYSTNSQYSTFVSASAVYGTLSLIGNTFVTDTASAYSTWSGGDKTIMFGNSIGGGTGTSSNSILILGMGQMLPSLTTQGGVEITPAITDTNINVGIKPTGAGSESKLTLWGASDRTNANLFSLGTNVAAANTLYIDSDFTGTGTLSPIALRFARSTKWTFATTGGIFSNGATGGDQGAGTINVSGGLYKNGSAYTNPDYVFEKYYTGQVKKFIANRGAKEYKGLMPLGQLEKTLRKDFALPGVHDTREIFARSDILLEKLEEAFLYIIELNKRVERLEKTR